MEQLQSVPGVAETSTGMAATGRVLGNLALNDDADGCRHYGQFMAERIREWRTAAGKRACDPKERLYRLSAT